MQLQPSYLHDIAHVSSHLTSHVQVPRKSTARMTDRNNCLLRSSEDMFAEQNEMEQHACVAEDFQEEGSRQMRRHDGIELMYGSAAPEATLAFIYMCRRHRSPFVIWSIPRYRVHGLEQLELSLAPNHLSGTNFNRNSELF